MNYNQDHTRLVLSTKYHELYSRISLKDLLEEHRNFRHYLVLFSIFQALLVMNVRSKILFRNLRWWFDISLTVYLWYGYLFAHINYAQIVLIKMAECWLVYNLTFHDGHFSYILEYVNIFQFIRKCWIFDVLIETCFQAMCYYVRVPFDNLD